MAGNSPADAAWAFARAVQDALACVTPLPVDYQGARPYSELPLVLSVAKGGPFALPGGNKLAMSVVFHFRVVAGQGEEDTWRTQPAGYY